MVEDKSKKTTAAAKTKKTPAVKKPASVKKTASVSKSVADKKTAGVEAKVEMKTEKYEQMEKDVAPVVKKAPVISEGKYIYAIGRRKTAVANVRLYAGNSDHKVNKKDIKTYFNPAIAEKAFEPLRTAGLEGVYYISAHINGGGSNSQAEALRHGIARALGTIDEDIRKVMKKNGFLTRDDRKKERKKPGLKRARRSPQWAKR